MSSVVDTQEMRELGSRLQEMQRADGVGYYGVAGRMLVAAAEELDRRRGPAFCVCGHCGAEITATDDAEVLDGLFTCTACYDRRMSAGAF